MRTRRSANEEVAEVARRRLEQLSAELAVIRPDPMDPPPSGRPDGSGEPPAAHPAAPRGPTGDPTRLNDGLPGRHAHRSLGPAVGAAGWVRDRLPPTLQGRVRMSAAHLGVVAVLVLGGLALTAWWVARANGEESVVPPLAAGASSVSSATGPGPGSTGDPTGDQTGPTAGGVGGAADPTAGVPSALVTSAPTQTGAVGSAAPGSAPPATGTIVVDVAGKVRRPGIATLPLGARVVDALESAGGPRRGARLGQLNLARVLADGEQIVVGVPAPPGVAATAAAAPTSAGGTPMVNINTATQAELEELPDIGPVTARSILDFRAENGTFTAVEELLEVSGIGDATLARVAPYVTL